MLKNILSYIDVIEVKRIMKNKYRFYIINWNIKKTSHYIKLYNKEHNYKLLTIT